MSKKVKFSPKHGLNPTQIICVFCGETKEIALLGKLKGDAKAPPKMIADYVPCAECQKKMDAGTTLMEVTRTEPADGRPPIGDRVWLTGRWCVIRREAAKAVFDTENKIVMLETKAYTEIFNLFNKGD